MRKSSPFIQMKAGSQTPPIFITPGVCGRAQFSGLAKHISTGNPIYGIQAKGVDGMEEPLERVEEMAAFYLEALEDLYPQGPYILIGYSFGGLVALEMAQRLWEQRKRVALLVLLDAYPHPRCYTRAVRMRLMVTRLKFHLKALRELPFPAAAAYFLNRLTNLLHIPGVREEIKVSPEMQRSWFDETVIQRVKEKAYAAYRSYRPRFYPGKIHFVTAQTKSFFPEDPSAVWGHLTASLEVDEIPGTHLNIVTTEFEPLAAVLTRYVEAVTCEPVEECLPAR